MLAACEILPLAVFVTVMILEIVAPTRAGGGPDGSRWFCNLALFAINSVLLAATSSVATTIPGDLLSVGWPSLPINIDSAAADISGTIISFLCLDLTAFWLHRTYHRIPFLWQLHAVHHSDLDVDSTTSVRHHSLEAALNFVSLAIASRLLGIPSSLFIAYGAIAMSAQLFQHANIRLPRTVMSVLEIMFVTPVLHQIHHVNDAERSNRNFGTLLSFWDRLFHTYSRQRYDQSADSFGCAGFEEGRAQDLLRLLWLRR